MKNVATKSVSTREFLLWLGALFAVSVAVVFGHALDNLGEVLYRDMVRSMLVLFAASSGILILCLRLFRPVVLVIPACVYLGFSFLAVISMIQGVPLRGYITIAILAVPVILLYLFSRGKNSLTVARVNFQVSALVAIATVLLTVFRLEAGPSNVISDNRFSDELAALVESASLPENKQVPDIFYIVPDRYPGARTLVSQFGYDNSGFYEELRNRGFTVVENGVANYPKTFQSMTSVLNADYLAVKPPDSAGKSIDQRPFYLALQGNRVQAILRRLGFDYIHFGNVWGPAQKNDHADENYRGIAAFNSRKYLNKFEYTLLQKTLFPHVGMQLGVDFFFPANECMSIKNQMNRLGSIGNSDRPKFVYAHFLVPHDPILINAEGQCISMIDYSMVRDNWEEFREGFKGYLQYFNSAVLEVFDLQTRSRGSSGRPFIFVIQSDEGPFPRTMRRGNRNFVKFSDDELIMKLGTLNAIRLSNGGKLNPAAMATPVNNWRIILGSLLNHEFGMLDHHVYIYPENDVYDYCDVSSLFGFEPAEQETCRVHRR